MKKTHFSIDINSPKEKVWNTMLDKPTYEIWTVPFCEGSSYKGSRDQGSKMLFVDPNGNGMVSEIEVSKPYEFVSIKHLGQIMNGIEDTTSDEVKLRSGSHENYTFSENNGVTTVSVDIDVAQEYEKMFEESRPKSLSKLKELCEKKE